MRFRKQFDEVKHSDCALTFTQPSCTVPDQSLTIPEIIARYTRSGLVPQSFAKRDEGGNVAMEPDFDPLDAFSDAMEAARLSRQRNAPKGSEKGQVSEEDPGADPISPEDPPRA